jgi:serine/threonine-protein kinase
MSNMVPVLEENAPSRLGRYRLIATLGQGGMGNIHLAIASGLGGFRKLFVVKELKAEFAHNEEFLRLFMREARLAARLNHANVVHTIEADHEHGRYFLAMEFLDGQPFSEILRRAQLAPSVPLGMRLQVLCHALAGLHHAHEIRDYDDKALQIVHCDVSPTNIFVTYDGQVKVLDFGIARAGNVEGTQPRAFKGKIGYAAPEQLRMRPGDRRADVFAAGIVLWEAIALRHFVRGKLTPKVFEARLAGGEPRIGQLIPDLDPALVEICDRAMSVDPDQRYPTAEAFRQELQDYLIERKLNADATEIARLVRLKFTDERSTLHRLIEDQLSHEEDVSHSFVAQRNPLLFQAAQNNALTGEQLLLEAGEAQDRAARFVRKSGVRLWVSSALALVAVAGAIRMQRADEAVPAQPAPAQKPAPVDARAKPEAPHEQVRDAPSTETPNAAEDKPISVPRIATSSPRAAIPAGHASAKAHGAPSTQGSHLDAGNLPQASGASATPAAVPVERPRMDVDLRSVQPALRRSLDVDNPFR